MTLFTREVGTNENQLQLLEEEMLANGWRSPESLTVTDQWPDDIAIDLVYIAGEFGPDQTGEYIENIESRFGENTIITLETMGRSISKFQARGKRPERILGLNWCEPVHTTYFMEIIANHDTERKIAEQLLTWGKDYWKKDPYLIDGDLGVRDRMFGALLREALFLSKEGYSSPADIDRACRNDAGSYLPFAGNFRYMDLMGTYLYGQVMEKLNGELSVDNSSANLLQEMVSANQNGMSTLKGFYDYDETSVKNMDRKMREWSYEVRKLMKKYNTPEKNHMGSY